MPILNQFAAEASGNVFTSLGIDWQMLILQLVGFLILVFILGRWVYPWLMKSVDERQEKIEAASKLAEDVKKEAAKAEEKTAALLEEARKEAADIVNTARLESTAAIAASEEKAKKQAEHIVSEAKEQIQKDVVAAKKALYDETLDLVATATEKVVGAKVDAKANESIIAKAIKEAN
jgi:F-type H+-transporting ATPase subunit b